jgi:hypothetical protein
MITATKRLSARRERGRRMGSLPRLRRARGEPSERFDPAMLITLTVA